MLTWLSARTTAAASLLSTNNSISATNTIESNMVMFNQIYYSTIAADSGFFDSTRIAQLYYLAGQCPITGGNAVFAARSLLSLVADTVFDDVSLCATGGDRMLHFNKPQNSDSSTEQIIVKLYPNPTKDYALLQINDDPGVVHLAITNALGADIFKRSVNFINGLYKINTTDLSSGVYYVTLYKDNQRIFSGKLCIFK